MGWASSFEGRPLTNGPAHGGAAWNYVTARFFDVFKIPLVRGRVFTERDDAAAPPVVIINEAMARQYWKNQDPIGQRLIIGAGMGPDFAQPPREIIGIVGDARDARSQQRPAAGHVRAAGAGGRCVHGAEQPLHAAELGGAHAGGAVLAFARRSSAPFRTAADLPVAHVRSMDQIVVRSTARDQFNTLLLGIFAFFAILLASIGLYGLMAYSVEQRTLEFGIRLALGANFAALRNMVVRQAMLLAAIGIVIGLAAAYGLTRLMATLLFQVKPDDPRLRLGGRVAGRGGAPGQLSAGAPGAARRPGGGAAVSVKERTHSARC